ncbi:peptide deformylase [Hasllibacter halocynthiae]|uniref:Peptide deformylase n=1 Tax=Hasllibacter halocynthiae TaxID=595589 RepID=A0A2T0X379_9RHOB|nr:peptide deformylase [Hasllibacter halocynthiae]PRY93406.1 peptide deformylase [Hasllibacter halocynthiae]
MPVRPIVLHPDERLRAVCAPVGAVTGQVRALADDLLETMYDAGGRGLAAPQVGVLRRLFVMDVGWKDGEAAPVVMVDPEVLDLSEARGGTEEACLSIPGEPRRVMRPSEVTMAWTAFGGERVHRRLRGMEARCAQHELDHLDGVLILDR